MLEQLHVIDRFALMAMIPGQSTSWAQGKVWEDCRKKLEYTSDEVIRYGLQITQNGLQWRQVIDAEFDEDGEYIPGTGTPINLLRREDEPIDNPLSDVEMKICKFARSLKKIEKAGQLMGVQLRLYEELVGPAPIDLEYLAAQADKEAEEDEEDDEDPVIIDTEE